MVYNLKRCILFVVLAVLMCFYLMQGVNACHDVPVEQLSAQEQDECMQRLQISYSDTEPKNDTFSCYDVHKDGTIAVLFRLGLYKGYEIGIYTSSMAFCHCITLYTEGAVHIEWDEDGNLRIFLIRASLAVTVDVYGECVAIQRIAALDSPRYMCYRITDRVDTNGNRYIAKNDTGFPNLSGVFSKIIRVNETGTEQVLYDVTSLHRSKAIAILITVIFFVAMFFGLLIKVIYNIFKR